MYMRVNGRIQLGDKHGYIMVSMSGAGLVYPQVARDGPEGVELFASLVTDKFNEKC